MQVSAYICYAAPDNRQVVVIARETFEHPQKTCIGFLLQIIRGEYGRFDPFDIPCMEILVTAQPEKLQIILVDFLSRIFRPVFRWQRRP